MHHTSIIIPPFGFLDSPAIVALSQYMLDGGTAIVLLDEKTHERELTATVALPYSERPEGHIWLKDWSENVGVPAALVAAGVVELTERTASCGFCAAVGAKFTSSFLKSLGKENRQRYIS